MIGILVQARTGSKRFPKKALAQIAGLSSLEWVFLRLSFLKDFKKVLLTSDNPADSDLVNLAHIYDYQVIRSSERDVLRRFAAAIKIFNFESVVRITGDCPLIDPFLVKKAIDVFIVQKPSYLKLTHVADGFDVEVIDAQVLLEADQKAWLPSEREHVVPYIQRYSKYKKLFVPGHKFDFSQYHLSLDYPEDLETLSEIVEVLGKRLDFSYEEVVKIIEEREDIKQKVLRHLPNEGYLKSLEEDKKYLCSLLKPPINLTHSEKWFEYVKNIIPLASQTYSKSYYLFSRSVSPLFAKKAYGCMLVDLDGNSYIDYTMALGACLLGYSFPPVNKAVQKQLEKGVVFTLSHPLEGEVAELLCENIPCAEMVRFGKNGSDVTSAAVRLARAYTGKDIILCCGYHGWQDWYIGVTTKDAGVPKPIKNLTKTFPYNDLKSLENIFLENSGRIACVIMEPVILDEPDPGFLEGVRKLCDREGALLIFDEVLTGFRFGLSGAQGRYDVIPDLSCFGKALGNGFPISAIVGRKEIMHLLENDVFFSFTFGGETLSLAAAKSTLHYLKENPVIENIWQLGSYFINCLKQIIDNYDLEDFLEVKGFPSRFVLLCKGNDSLLIKTFIQQECIKRGELFTGSFNLSFSHDTSIVDKTCDVLDYVLRFLKYSLEYGILENLIYGQILKNVFQVRSHQSNI